MSSTKGKLFRLLSNVMLKRASVIAAEDVGGFRRLVLQDRQGGTPWSFAAGTKVQVLLPSNDTRTYTPIRSSDGLVLLGWKHAGGPGARWMTSVNVGDEVSFLGPQRSLELAPGPVIMIGDETSVAVAASFEAERPGEVHALIQADTADDVRAAAASVGLHQLDVLRRGDHQGTVDAVVCGLSTARDSVLGLTGCSKLVVGVRRGLRVVGVRAKTKTYWVPGKTGLD